MAPPLSCLELSLLNHLEEIPQKKIQLCLSLQIYFVLKEISYHELLDAKKTITIKIFNKKNYSNIEFSLNMNMKVRLRL